MHGKTGLALRLQFARRLVDASGDGEAQLVELLGADDVQVVGQLVAVLVTQVVVGDNAFHDLGDAQAGQFRAHETTTIGLPLTA